MAIPLQFRRGTEAQNDAFTGALGELSVDMTNNALRIHDAATAGGTKVANLSDDKGFKSHLLNGGFDSRQRGDSFLNVADGAYTFDQWLNSSSGTPDIALGGGATYGNTMVVTLDNVSTAIVQLLENYGQKAYNVPLTLSFWVRGSIASTAEARLRNNTTATTIESISYNITASWTKVELTFIASTSWSLNDVGNLAIARNFSALDTISFAKVQLEVGEVATDFEQLHPDMILSSCQRYYERFVAPTGTDICNLQAYNTTLAYGSFTMCVEKRVAPTLTISAANTFLVFGNGASQAPSAMSVSYANKNKFEVTATITTVGGSALWMRSAVGQTAYIEMNSEL